MTDASDDTITRTGPSAVAGLGPVISGIAAALGLSRKSLQAAEAAHASRCGLASFSTEDFQDTGIDPSDATGIASWQPDLPFFMQSGFNRR